MKSTFSLIVFILLFHNSIQASSNSSDIVATEIQCLIHKNNVTLFSKTFCPHSKRLKRILAPYNLNQMKVVELDLRNDTNVFQAELQKISALKTVPQLFVNGKFVGNADSISKMDKENKLRPMLEEEKILST